MSTEKPKKKRKAKLGRDPMTPEAKPAEQPSPQAQPEPKPERPAAPQLEGPKLDPATDPGPEPAPQPAEAEHAQASAGQGGDVFDVFDAPPDDPQPIRQDSAPRQSGPTASTERPGEAVTPEVEVVDHPGSEGPAGEGQSGAPRRKRGKNEPHERSEYEDFAETLVEGGDVGFRMLGQWLLARHVAAGLMTQAELDAVLGPELDEKRIRFVAQPLARALEHDAVQIDPWNHFYIAAGVVFGPRAIDLATMVQEMNRRAAWQAEQAAKAKRAA